MKPTRPGWSFVVTVARHAILEVPRWQVPAQAFVTEASTCSNLVRPARLMLHEDDDPHEATVSPAFTQRQTIAPPTLPERDESRTIALTVNVVAEPL